MKKKQTFIILGVMGFVFVLFWFFVIALVVKTLRGASADEVEAVEPTVEATLCDEDASDLCIVNFGANSLNRMVINFRLPNREYAAFYVKARNRDTVSVYTCEVDEFDLTAVRCTGVRAPLGETIDLEIYTTDGDKLIARGMFLVSAIAISTPISRQTEPPATEEITTEEFPTEQFLTEEVPATAPSIEEGLTPPPKVEFTPESVSPPSP